MSGTRAAGHGMERGKPVQITVDGSPCKAYEGESVAAAVMAQDRLELRRGAGDEPRGYFCGMGVCFDCVMTVDGTPKTRTCVTWVREGLAVEREQKQ